MMPTRPTKVQALQRAARDSTSFLEGYLPYLLGHASAVMNRDFDTYVKSAGLSPLEWRTLASLADEDGLTIGALCKKAVALQPSLTKAIKRLHEAGLVRREDDDTDLRKTRAFIAPRGLRLTRELMKAALAHEGELTRHLTGDQVKLLKRTLREVLAQRRLSDDLVRRNPGLKRM